MIRRIPFYIAAILLTAMLAACARNFYSNSPQALAPSYTAYAKTFILELTLSVSPTAKPKTPTPENAGTPTPASGTPSEETATSTYAGPCYNDAYIVEQTIPDWTKYDAGGSFKKKWTIRNAGTCTWDQDYKLVLVKGDQMKGGEPYIDESVKPEKSIEITIKMAAPASGGDYCGYWQLRDLEGKLFGERASVCITVNQIATSTSTRTKTSVSTTVTTATPTRTPTRTYTRTFTATPSRTATRTPTQAPSQTFTSTSAPTFTLTNTVEPTSTPTNTETTAPIPTDTPTLEPTSTETPTPTST